MPHLQGYAEEWAAMSEYDQDKMQSILREDTDNDLNLRALRLLTNLNAQRRLGTSPGLTGAHAFYRLALREIGRRRMHRGLP